MLNLSENITLFEHKNGGVGSKSFYILLLKSSFHRLSRNIFSGSWCIRASGTSQHRLLRMSFLLTLGENIPFFKYKNGGVRPQNCYV